MEPKIAHVEPRENAVLSVAFANGEERLFDVSPYLDKGVFRELADANYFLPGKRCGEICPLAA